MAKRSNKARNTQPLRTLRFAISPQAGDALLASTFVRRIAMDEREDEESTVYYDTAGGTLKEKGLLLALTRNTAGNVQSLECSSNYPKAGFAPPPATLPAEGEKPGASALHDLAGAARLSCPDLAVDELLPRLTLRFKRHRLLVKWRGSLFRIIHDRGECLDGEQSNFIAPFSEIALQQNTGKPESLFDLALALSDRTDWRQIGLSRGDIALSALGAPSRPGRRKARSCAIGEKESCGKAFEKVMEESLAQFLANDPSVIGDTAEAVHQSRVAIRRLRAGLRAFKPVLPPRERKAFNADFRWLQQALGQSRDWHVFQSETLPAIAGLDNAQRKSLDELANRQQAKGLTAAIEALASRRATRLILRFQHWLHMLAEGDGSLERPARKLAARLARRSFRRLAAAGPLDTRRPMAEIHAIRIRGKQLRYALEFFAALEALAPFMPALPALKALQTHLGNANDAAVALKLLSGDIRTPLAPTGRDTIERWAAARIIDCVAEARPALAHIHEIFGT